MRTLLVPLGAALCFLVLACAPGPAAPAGVTGQATGTVPVTLASWNVANFFDTVDDPNEDTVLSPNEWERKRVKVAEVLVALDSDFVALVEVENLDCLRALNASLPSPYPQMGLIEGNDQRGIDVAFLSRLPVARVRSYREFDLPEAPGVSRGYRFSRDCLLVQLRTEPPASLLINHFKSQLGGKKESASKRRVQAQGVVEIAAQVARAKPEGFEVVMGDLNDGPGSWSLEPVMEEFVDVFEGWPKNLRMTHRSRHGGSSLDHILVSPDVVSRLDNARVWSDLGKSTSDHDPVSVAIRLDASPAEPAPVRVWSRSD
jgi:endonuclease/exonuclease/phosphatase family metal-dependent hydrolase